MTRIMLGFCIFAAACSGASGSPTAPSGVVGVTGIQAQGSGSANVEVTFTKWIDPAFPTSRASPAAMSPVTLPQQCSEERRSTMATSLISQARYEVIASNPARAFTVLIEGKQNNQTQKAVLNGTVIDGWLTGARVHVTFDVVGRPPNSTRASALRELSGSSRVLPIKPTSRRGAITASRVINAMPACCRQPSKTTGFRARRCGVYARAPAPAGRQYNCAVITRGIREFVARDRAAVREQGCVLGCPHRPSWTAGGLPGGRGTLAASAAERAVVAGRGQP